MPIWKSARKRGKTRRYRMNPMNKERFTSPESAPFFHGFFSHVVAKIKKTEHLKLIWWCLAWCLLCGTLARYLPTSTGLTYGTLAVLGSGGCAWFWLLSRALFRDSMVLNTKAVYVVAVIIAVEAIEAMMPPASLNGAANEIYRVFSNVASFICITAIVFVWNDALSGFNRIRSVPEQRFRVFYLAVFSVPVALAIFWLMGAEAGTLAAKLSNDLLTCCAFIVLISSRLAVEYRLKTLRADSLLSRLDETSQNDEANLLADKVIDAIQSDVLLTQSNLKVSDLAEHIGAQEYKVTRCITHTLKFRNFNHMVNKYRIERALELLKNPEKQHLNIATIAFDCGYNSLGPFNRAFKQHVDKTPRQFRQDALAT